MQLNFSCRFFLAFSSFTYCIKDTNGTPEAPQPQCDIMTVEWISQGTWTTLTDYMGPSLLKRSTERMMENKSKR